MFIQIAVIIKLCKTSFFCTVSRSFLTNYGQVNKDLWLPPVSNGRYCQVRVFWVWKKSFWNFPLSGLNFGTLLLLTVLSKSSLSVCLLVCQFGIFLRNVSLVFLFFSRCWIIGIFKSWQLFLTKWHFVQIWERRA